MKILIVGSGGREHAIAYACSKSPKVDKIYCAPGNAGISELAECVPISAMEFDRLADFAAEKEIDLTVIGMDDPLVGGIVDLFEARGLRVFGPRKNAAILEGSKAFSKDLMKKYNIPTAAYETFTSADDAKKYLETSEYPIVLKADGLALGKGVLICNTKEEALAGVDELMLDKKFGDAGNTIVIEEFMTGREVSVLSFVDGNTIKIMSSAQDHKRAKDGDEGLNTGGMGNFSPSPFYTEEVDDFCKKHIYQATVDAMASEGREFKGIIFFGLMLILISSLFQNAEAEVLLSIGKISLYKVGFIRGCRMSSVILTLAGGLLLFTETTQVQDLMAVLGKMGLSSNVVYMVVASFRSINELSDKMGQILEAQSSRGIETEGNLFVRLKAILPMLITLLLSSMVSAEEKAIALEARCFNCHCKRTSLRVNNTSRADVVTMIGIAFVTAALIAVKFIFIK